MAEVGEVGEVVADVAITGADDFSGSWGEV